MAMEDTTGRLQCLVSSVVLPRDDSHQARFALEYYIVELDWPRRGKRVFHFLGRASRLSLCMTLESNFMRNTVREGWPTMGWV